MTLVGGKLAQQLREMNEQREKEIREKLVEVIKLIDDLPKPQMVHYYLRNNLKNYLEKSEE